MREADRDMGKCKRTYTNDDFVKTKSVCIGISMMRS